MLSCCALPLPPDSVLRDDIPPEVCISRLGLNKIIENSRIELSIGRKSLIKAVTINHGREEYGRLPRKVETVQGHLTGKNAIFVRTFFASKFQEIHLTKGCHNRFNQSVELAAR